MLLEQLFSLLLIPVLSSFFLPQDVVDAAEEDSDPIPAPGPGE